MQITYQKSDGSIIQRYRKTMIPYKIGEETSMRWKVLNIEYEYDNKYYPEYKYNILIQKNKKAFIKKQQARELYKKEIKTFLYCIVAVLVINFLKVLLGI